MYYLSKVGREAFMYRSIFWEYIVKVAIFAKMNLPTATYIVYYSYVPRDSIVSLYFGFGACVFERT